MKLLLRITTVLAWLAQAYLALQIAVLLERSERRHRRAAADRYRFQRIIYFGLVDLLKEHP